MCFERAWNCPLEESALPSLTKEKGRVDRQNLHPHTMLSPGDLATSFIGLVFFAPVILPQRHSEQPTCSVWRSRRLDCSMKRHRKYTEVGTECLTQRAHIQKIDIFAKKRNDHFNVDRRTHCGMIAMKPNAWHSQSRELAFRGSEDDFR